MSGKTSGGSFFVLAFLLILAAACFFSALPFLQTAALRLAGG